MRGPNRHAIIPRSPAQILNAGPIMTEHRSEFGKRRPPASPPPSPPSKRSRHVALLLMGTLAIGGGAYALMPRRSCAPASPTMAAPSQGDDACARSNASSGSSGHWHAFDSGGNREGGSGTSDSASSPVARGGFGGIAHAMGESGGG